MYFGYFFTDAAADGEVEANVAPKLAFHTDACYDLYCMRLQETAGDRERLLETG